MIAAFTHQVSGEPGPAQSTKFTLLRVIPTESASNASCCERSGRNPYEKPRKSSS